MVQWRYCYKIRKSGKNSFIYEIRYRANGYYIIASSTDLRKAKEKFLAKTTPEEIEKYRVQKIKTGQDTFEEIFDEWYMVKEGTITDKALKTYNTNFEELPEKIRKTPIETMISTSVKRFIFLLFLMHYLRFRDSGQKNQRPPVRRGTQRRGFECRRGIFLQRNRRSANRRPGLSARSGLCAGRNGG